MNMTLITSIESELDAVLMVDTVTNNTAGFALISTVAEMETTEMKLQH